MDSEDIRPELHSFSHLRLLFNAFLIFLLISPLRSSSYSLLRVCSAMPDRDGDSITCGGERVSIQLLFLSVIWSEMVGLRRGRRAQQIKGGGSVVLSSGILFLLREDQEDNQANEFFTSSSCAMLLLSLCSGFSFLLTACMRILTHCRRWEVA